jgi:hypothetical protein
MILTIHLRPESFEGDTILVQSTFPLDYEKERYTSAMVTDEFHCVISFALNAPQLNEEQVNWLERMRDQHLILNWEAQQ